MTEFIETAITESLVFTARVVSAADELAQALNPFYKVGRDFLLDTLFGPEDFADLTSRTTPNGP